MTKGLLIINGFPATGKTTLARDLAGALGWPLFTKDGIKERLFDVLGWGDEEWSEQLSHAVIEVLFDVAETLGGLGPAGPGEVGADRLGGRDHDVEEGVALGDHLAIGGVVLHRRQPVGDEDVGASFLRRRQPVAGP